MKRTAPLPRVFVVIILVVLAAVAATAFPAEVPEAVAEALASSDQGTVIRMRWAALDAFPPLARLLELRDSEQRLHLGPVEMILEPYFKLAGTLPVEADAVSDVWLTSRGVGQIWGGRMWIGTRLTTAELHEAFDRAGWEPTADDGATYRQPIPPDEAAELEEQLAAMAEALEWDEEEIEEARSAYAPRTVVSVLPDGWLAWGTTMMESPQKASDGETVTVSDEELPFPATELLELDSPVLLAIGVRTGGPDEGLADPESEVDSEVAALQRRISELNRRDERTISERMGSFLVVASETDGGLRVDVTVQRPDGGDASFAADLVEMALLFLRMAALGHPDLERELASATVSYGAGEARAELLLSLATLHQTLEDEVSRQIELVDLYERLAELEEHRDEP